jgi:hypothetical protein
MKAVISVACLLATAVTATESPIGGVVKQLQSMAEQSKSDAKDEAKLFEKFQCYCDKTISDTTKQITSLTDQIGTTQARITALTAVIGELAQKKATTSADIDQAKLLRAQAAAMRNKSRNAFLKEEADLNASLTQLNDALAKLNVTGSKLIEVVAHTRKGDGFLEPSFLQQAPSGSTGGVSGVLISTRDTYASNLDQIRRAEAGQQEAFAKLSKTKDQEIADLTTMLAQTEQSISDTKSELAAKQDAIKTAQDNLNKTTVLKADTQKLCAEKTKINEDRKIMRAQEDSAISEAIAVLNSDAAFETFARTKTTGSFLQLASIHRHGVEQRRPEILSLLRVASHDTHSSRLAGIAAMVAVGNPFEKVIEEITKMQQRIVEEGQVDKKKFDWCKAETEAKTINLNDKKVQTMMVTGAIAELTETIDTTTKSLAESESRLVTNQEDQKAQTALRKTESATYEKSIADLVTTQGLLGKATQVLQSYYKKVAKPAFLQTDESDDMSEDQAPKINDGAYTGQNSTGVVALLEKIRKDAKAEEKAAHAAEQKAQASYEDSMKALVDQEKSLRDGISTMKGDLAQARLDRDNSKADLVSTQKESQSIGDYLASIKSGCDFIKANFDLRNASRVAESKALTDATTLIKGTPAYQNPQKKK